MPPETDTTRYKNHRFPGEIIGHEGWLYYRFTLSYRDVQELLFERGIAVSHEAIRKWWRKFGQDYAKRIGNSKALLAPPRRPPRPPGSGVPPPSAGAACSPAMRGGAGLDWTGTADGGLGGLSEGILHAFQRGFYTLNGMRDTSPARTSLTSLRTTA